VPDTIAAAGVPRVPASLIGRLDIPNLRLTAMRKEPTSTRYAWLWDIYQAQRCPEVPAMLDWPDTGTQSFVLLRNIHVRDKIELTTQTATYRYEVESTRIVSPRDVQVLAPTAGASVK
jgi:hypothetical protein